MGATVTISTQSTAPEPPANLAALVVDLIRQVRILKAEYVAAAELLQVALDLLRTADKDRDRARESMIASRDEARALRAELAALRAERPRDQVTDTLHLPENTANDYAEAVQ
jgi:hypothetical protein